VDIVEILELISDINFGDKPVIYPQSCALL